MLGILAFVASAQQIRIDKLNPSVGECFRNFREEMIDPNYPQSLELRGGSFSKNATYPVHLISYIFRQNTKDLQQFLWYAQFGECTDTTKTVFQINNSHPDSLGTILEPLVRCLGCSCAYEACRNDLKFTVEVHAFGDHRGRVDYERSLMDRVSIIHECSFFCFERSNSIASPKQDPPACTAESCYGDCSSDQDLNDPYLCSGDFVPDQINRRNKEVYFDISIAMVPIGLLIGIAYYLGMEKLCNRRVGRDLNPAPRRAAG